MTEKAFSQLIKGNQVRYEKPNIVMSEALGMSVRSTVSYINNPKDMTVEDLMIVVKELHIRSEDLIEFLKGESK